MLYESMLLFGIAFAAGLVFSIAGQMKSGIDPRRPLLLAFLVVVIGIYFTWCWSRGQTLAMRTWKIRVAGRDGRPPHQLRAFFRYACSWLWILPPLAIAAPLKLSAWQITAVVGAWMGFWALLSFANAQRQFLHDLLAGTRLVPAEG